MLLLTRHNFIFKLLEIENMRFPFEKLIRFIIWFI